MLAGPGAVAAITIRCEPIRPTAWTKEFTLDEASDRVAVGDQMEFELSGPIDITSIKMYERE